MIVMFVRSVVRSDAAERRVGVAGAPCWHRTVCVAELCAAGASSYLYRFHLRHRTVCVA